MRLSQILAVWPRNRPNGHIWSGKHRMVEKVKHNHMVKMEKSIQMVRYDNTTAINTKMDVCRKKTTCIFA